MSPVVRSLAVLAAATLPVAVGHAQASRDAAKSDSPLEEVIVTATLRPQTLTQVPASVTVLDNKTLGDAGQQHFQDVLALVPNLGWAGGTSRPRFFQIRGIGEREQYEGAPNPSVGFLIDDIDFSGLGMPATLFDVARVEVLRGPQGTRYGANALAGLIAVHSADPGTLPGYAVDATLADFGTGSLGFTATAPVQSLNSSWRFAVQRYRTGGFTHNTFLDRNTNARDELTGRFKWRFTPSDATTIDATVLHANLDNGYDAFAIDNSRHTLSNRPGEDSQRATGASVRVVTTAWEPYTLTAIGSYADSKSINSFDADWGNAASWAPYTYDYYSSSSRDRSTANLELRLASPAAQGPGAAAWLAGVYLLDLNEDGRDLLEGVYADPSDPSFDGTSDDALANRYDATNVAVFGQLDGFLSERWRWSAGMRLEQRTAHYRDSGIWGGGPQVTDLSARNRMLGGQVSLSFDLTTAASTYVSLSRGYKAGGFNLGAVPPGGRYFAPEYLWNVEAGIKSGILNGRGFVDGAVFYEARRNLQVRTGKQLDPANPGTYLFITDNLDRGYNLGMEGTIRYFVSPALEVGGSVGLLRTRASGGLDENGVPVATREQAHAPEYQLGAYGTWRHASGFMVRADVNAQDNFYFDVPSDHNQQSPAYTTVNLKVGFEQPAWNVYAWVRNAFDTDYAVRGFYFYNEPPFVEKKLYTQPGDPRQLGVTFNWSFY
ncbi:MAG: TonB-dependent receptor [Steroidobacteraceae bacterium]